MHRPAFLRYTAAALGVLMAQMGAASFAELSRQYGPGRKSHKQLTDGTPSTTSIRRTRQMERAEGRAEIKAMDRRFAQRQRDNNALDLERRKAARMERELTRRDARFGVHAIIERGRFGSLSRRQLA